MRGGIPLSLTMAWRETRGGWRRFVFFVLCVAVGVGAVVGIDLFTANVEGLILGDARSLLGGDVEIQVARDLGPSGRTVVAELQDRRIDVTHVKELVGMAAVTARPPGGQVVPGGLSQPGGRPPPAAGPAPPGGRTAQLVELKAVESTYPLYGAVDVSPDRPLQTLLAPVPSCPRQPCFGIVVQDSLLILLGLDRGARLKIGRAWFEIRGVLIKEPDRVASAFSLGPRAMISRDALAATDLVQTGSRIRQRYLLRLPASLEIDPLLGELRGRLAEEGARVSSFRNAQPRIRNFLDQFTTWLGLVALTTLLVGGLGIACTMHGFITHKLTTVAILKTLGAEAGFLMRVYLAQSGVMGGVGSVLGVAAGVGLQLALPVMLGRLLPVTVSATVYVMPVIKGLLLGLGVTLLFTLWPLLTIRAVPPALVFRRDVEWDGGAGGSASDGADDGADSTPTLFSVMPAQTGIRSTLKRLVTAPSFRTLFHDRQKLLTGGVMGAGLLALAMWQARAVELGAVFLLAFGAALVLLRAGVWLLLAVVRRAPRPRAPVARYALGRVRRPGHDTMSMAVAIGVGVMVMTTVAMVKASLLTALGDRIPESAPTFFFVDIQPDQTPVFERIMRAHAPAGAFTLTPVVRTRLASLNGARVNPEAHAETRDGWYFTREYVLTESADLPKDNVIVEGAWWPAVDADDAAGATAAGPPGSRRAAVRVSVEEEAARILGLEVGSTMAFDVQGVRLSAVVASLRKVDWGSFSTNFYMILSPTSLDGAPMTYLSAATVAPNEEVPLQQAMVRALPNVTAIQIGDVLANVAQLLSQLAWVIQGMAALTLVSGAAVMVAALSSTRYRRVYEAAVLKVVGGTRRVLAQAFALEFAVVGMLAGALGVALAAALSWAVLYFVLDLPWVWQPAVMLLALAATVTLAVVVGFMSTWRILGEPPLAVLRRE